MKTRISVVALCASLFAPALAAAQEIPVTSPTDTGAANPPGAAPAPPATTPGSPAVSADKASPASSASATTPREDKPRRGFLLRMQLGGGYRSASSGTGSTAVDVSGTGIGFSVLVGGAAADNVFLYGEVLADYATNPTVEAGQKKGVADNTSIRVVGIGPGITYMMPDGFHLGGTIFLARMTIEQNEQEIGSTDTGFGAAARIGKDFWLGEHHALGIVGQFMFASMDDEATSSTAAPSTFSTTAFTLALSGTYN